VGTDGAARLAVLTAPPCGNDAGTSLYWLDPVTRHADVLLGPGVNGGQVLAALEFPDDQP
jgi:hypothetical protein